MSTDSPRPVIVDYGMSLAEMINAGRYDFVDRGWIEKRFAVKGQGKVELDIHLVNFALPERRSRDVIRELEKMGLRPAKVEELLAFGARYPDVQRQFPIMALGSSSVNTLLLVSYGDRGVLVDLFDLPSGERMRFAAVRR